jgi:hypothetical protein
MKAKKIKHYQVAFNFHDINVKYREKIFDKLAAVYDDIVKTLPVPSKHSNFGEINVT